MTETIKVPALSRMLDTSDLEIRAVANEPVRIKFSGSSTYKVNRGFGNEVLEHSASSIRMQRANAGAIPLLFNHDFSNAIGMVDSVGLSGERTVVNAHLFDTELGRNARSMIEGGLKNFSVQYRVHKIRNDAKSDTMNVTDWEPFEYSLVTVPEDPTVGIGRSMITDEFEAELTRSIPAQVATTSGAKQMADGDTAAAGASADKKEPVITAGGTSASDMEAARVNGIKMISRACKIDDRIRDMWITAGLGLDKVNEDINGIVQSREANNPKSAFATGMDGKDAKRFSFAKALIAASTGNWNDAGFELDCSRAIYNKMGKPLEANKFAIPMEVGNFRRDLTVATASAGGYLVGTDNQSFIELLRNRTVVYNLGATRLPGLVGNVTIPKQTAAATPVWLANEASTVTESAQTFGQLALSPKTVGAYVEISRQLLLQSAPAAEQIAQSDVAAVAAIAIDLASLSGSGAGGQPTGITNTGGIGTFTGTSLAAPGVLDAQSDVIGANVVPTSPGYVTTAAVAALLMARPELPTTGTTRLWTGTMIDGQLFNFRAMVSAQMATATMLFGDWSKLVIGEWGGLEVETNPYANFQAGIIGIRALLTIDVGVRYAAAFSLGSTIT